MTVLKKEKKAAALKKYLLRKCNYCVEVVTLKKCEKVASPKIKLSCKSRNTCVKGNQIRKGKQIRLLIEIIFQRGFLTLESIHMRFPMYTGSNGGRN